MSEFLPLFLREAVLTLYRTDANGNPLLTAPVWFGACANNLNLRLGFEGELSFQSGDRYKTERHTDETHLIEIERSWVIQKINAAAEAAPERNTEYVLEIVWTDRDPAGFWYWKKRVYYGVTGRHSDLNSEGIKRFVNQQALRAKYFTPDGGTDVPDIFTPIVDSSTDQPIGFFREDDFITGEYFLGHYRWPVGVTIKSAKIIGWAPQVTAQEITLEINGLLTSTKLILPIGSVNTEVTNEVTGLSLAVPLGQSVRWKITNGPAPISAAWHAAIVMQIEVDA